LAVVSGMTRMAWHPELTRISTHFPLPATFGYRYSSPGSKDVSVSGLITQRKRKCLLSSKTFFPHPLESMPFQRQICRFLLLQLPNVTYLLLTQVHRVRTRAVSA